jgi:hypothetical protein
MSHLGYLVWSSLAASLDKSYRKFANWKSWKAYTYNVGLNLCQLLERERERWWLFTGFSECTIAMLWVGLFEMRIKKTWFLSFGDIWQKMTQQQAKEQLVDRLEGVSFSLSQGHLGRPVPGIVLCDCCCSVAQLLLVCKSWPTGTTITNFKRCGWVSNFFL